MNSTCELGRHSARALKPYPAYKDSRIEWLGEVPKHWQVRRLKTLCSRSALYGANVAATSYTTAGVRFLRTTDITENGQLNGRGVFLPQESVDNYLLADGDVLISRSGTIGRSFLYERRIHGPCAYAGYLVRFVPAPIALPKYILLFTKTHAFAGFLRVKAISSTIENVNGEKYANCPLPLPPHSEQAAIVRFLDHADRRIRRYICAKQKLILLLEEQKQAIIHRAVTGQIDVRTGRPYPAYRPSGVDWLEPVPVHWDIRPAKWHFREVDDRSETGAEELLSVSHITGVTPRSEKNVTMFKAESNIGYKLCAPGDIVINTMWAWMAALGLVRQAGVVSPAYAVYRPRGFSGLHGEYVDLLLRTTAYRGEYMCRSTGIRSSRLRLYPEEFLRMKILCPELEEQHAIVDFVRRQSARVRRSVETTNCQLAFLQEYRTRLINDVVIGKLDVRDVAAGLPDVDSLPAYDLLDGGNATHDVSDSKSDCRHERAR